MQASPDGALCSLQINQARVQPDAPEQEHRQDRSARADSKTSLRVSRQTAQGEDGEATQ